MSNARTHRRRREGGFTIVETVIAMGISAIALVGVAKVVTECTVLQQVTREDAVIHAATRDLMEQLRSHQPNQILESFGPDANGSTISISLSRMTSETTAGMGVQYQAAVHAPGVDGASGSLQLGDPQFTWSSTLLGQPSLTSTQMNEISEEVVPVRLVNTWRSAAGTRTRVIDTFILKP